VDLKEITDIKVSVFVLKDTKKLLK